MSNKLRSLGSVAGATRGILLTGGTNATPIVGTFTAGHRMKDGDRIGVVGVTGLTAANGDWTVQRATDTTYRLLGSRGNGVFGGTAVVAALMDLTPHQQNHAAVVALGQTFGQAVLVGTLVIEGADNRKADNTNFQYTDSAGALVDGFVSALKSGEVAIPAVTAGGSMFVEVDLKRYMTVRCSAYTSGGASAVIIA